VSRRSRRERIVAAFEAFHSAAEAALGASERLRDRVTQRHAETMVELWLREAGFDAADCLFKHHCFTVLVARRKLG